MNIAKYNDWVEIEEILLESGSRAPQVLEDTQSTPLKQWIKGYLINEQANIGDLVEIETMAGRKVSGELSDINPSYSHDFGAPIKELLDVGRELKQELRNLKK